MFSRTLRLGAAALGASALLAGTAAGAATGPPPPPKATGGQTVTTVASGLGTPTSFAVGDGSVFEGDGGNSQSGPPNGGVFLLKNGTGTKLAGSPNFVAGLAWHQGSLYVSAGFVTAAGFKFQLLKWSGWNGTAFTSQKVIYTAPKKFAGFNGIAFGPDGRLYVGAGVGPAMKFDHNPASAAPYLYDILSINPNGKGLKIYATGIRQPWQMVFPKGSKSPLISALGQDSGVKNPPDFLLKVRAGQKYGFPKCNWTVKSKCKAFAKPYKFFSPHFDPMGLAIIGSKLYITSFTGHKGAGQGEVFSMPLKGGAVTPFLTGFVAPIVGLGENAGTLYVGELTGQVFSVKP
jgi:glucose/arabinose dehydrogenase